MIDVDKLKERRDALRVFIDERERVNQTRLWAASRGVGTYQLALYAPDRWGEEMAHTAYVLLAALFPAVRDESERRMREFGNHCEKSELSLLVANIESQQIGAKLADSFNALVSHHADQLEECERVYEEAIVNDDATGWDELIKRYIQGMDLMCAESEPLYALFYSSRYTTGAASIAATV